MKRRCCYGCQERSSTCHGACERYERFMDQANSVNDKLSKNIMKVVDQR